MKWISVKDKLPENSIDVLILTNEGGCHFCHVGSIWGKKEWATHSEVLHHVTHWMQLPELPEEACLKKKVSEVEILDLVFRYREEENPVFREDMDGLLDFARWLFRQKNL